MQVAHILFYSQIPVIKRIIHHTRSDDRTAVQDAYAKLSVATFKIIVENTSS